MNEMSIEAFERRAKEAEERLERLEKKVASKSGGGMSDERLCEVLEVLYEVRATLGKERHRSELSAKRQSSLEGQNRKLEEDNSKLRYQILHLKRNLENHMAG